MTQNNSLHFSRRAWAFPNIMGMPAGLWTAAGEAEGDASGGEQTYQHIFRNASNLLGDSNYYSIEHTMVRSTASASNGFRLRINGMDTGTGDVSNPDNPINREYALVLADTDVSTVDKSIEPRNANIPIWVGTYQGAPTDLGDVIVATKNEGATETTGVYLSGFWWTPDATNAPGGLIRPPNSIYGA